MKNAEQKLENSKKSANDAIQKAQSDVQNAEDKMNREFGAYILSILSSACSLCGPR